MSQELSRAVSDESDDLAGILGRALLVSSSDLADKLLRTEMFRELRDLSATSVVAGGQLERQS